MKEAKTLRTAYEADVPCRLARGGTVDARFGRLGHGAGSRSGWARYGLDGLAAGGCAPGVAGGCIRRVACEEVPVKKQKNWLWRSCRSTWRPGSPTISSGRCGLGVISSVVMGELWLGRTSV